MPSPKSLSAFVAVLLLSCGSSQDPASPDAGPTDAGPAGDVTLAIPQSLSGYGLFESGRGADGQLLPAAGTVPYTLTTALFSDYALKSRTLTIPPGRPAKYQPDAVLDFPVGTILTKTFSFPADLRQPEQDVRLIETRVLVRQPSGWEFHPYVWNAEQTDATLAPGGRVVPVSFIDLAGGQQELAYLVPSRNQCQQCHHLVDDQGKQVMRPIGPKARYLNRDDVIEGVSQNQLTWMASTGLLEGLPANPPRAPDAFNPGSGELEARARAYLDINCAHCHNTRGTAGITSRLFLEHDQQDPFSLGVCKRPGSAGGDVGGEYDVVPGDHTRSILWFRVHTAESGKMMPQIGRALSHLEGAQLIADWIDAMPARECR